MYRTLLSVFLVLLLVGTLWAFPRRVLLEEFMTEW